MPKTITPLPANVAGMSRDEVVAAALERQGRVEELKKASERGDIDAGVAEVELKAIKDDIGRLDTWVQPHPGFPSGGGRRQTEDGLKYGRVDGLGADFVKAMGTKALDGTSGGASMPGAWFDPRIRDLPQRRLFVRSLLPTFPVTSDRVEYLRQTVLTNNAGAVAAGALKPTSVITVARETAPIRVIAHVSEALDRSILSDTKQLADFIDRQMRLGVLLEEEDQIINGDGTAPNLSGILDQTGLQTQAKGADPTPDAIHKAMTKVRNVFLEPDGVVMHPADWEEVALLRTSDGEYIWGSPAEDAPPRIWGKPVIVTPVIAEGTALVGAFGTAAEVYEREGARVSFAETGLGDSAGEELFSRNLVRFRGESRLGLGVIRPDGFCSVTGV